MHRLAFKALLTGPPERQACLRFFHEHRQSFVEAARAKIARLALPFDRSLHVNSRDIRRALAADGKEGQLRLCRVLERA